MTTRFAFLSRLASVAGLFTLSFFLLAGSAAAQTAGDYRSAASGNWNAASTWETYDGANWVPAGAGPTSANGVITIRSPHVVTISASGLSYDQVVVDAGGQVTVAAGITTTLANGAGTDLTINGTWLHSGGTWTISASATWAVGSGGTYIHNTTSSAATPLGVATLNSASTLIYRGSSTLQTSVAWSGRTFGNVSFESTSGTWTLTGITGTTATLVAGNFTIGTSVSIPYSYTGTLTVGGNYTNNGTLTYGAGTQRFDFTGSGKTISGTGSISFETLNISSGSLTLSVPVTLLSGFTGTISGGATLATAATFTNSGTLNVFGTFQINQGGWATGNNFVYDTPSFSTLAFTNTAGSYGVNNDAFWPTLNPPYNVLVSGAGGITMNVARTVEVVETNAGVGGTALTINGACSIASGGYFDTAPNYGSSSQLYYHTGGTYGRYNEWSATSGPGYPANVFISGNTKLDLGNGGTGTARQCSGYLNIAGGSELSMNNGANDMTAALTVLGNLTVNGTLSLSDALGGDLDLKGNWSSAVSSTFNPNDRAVTFSGGSPQTLARTGGLVTGFDYLIMSGVGLTISSDVTVNKTLTFNSGKITTGVRKVTVTPGGNVIGAGAGTGYVSGNLKKRCQISAGSGSQAWEVGDATYYAPTAFSTTSGLTQLDITASTTGGDHPNVGSSGIQAGKTANRYWTMTLDNGQSFTSGDLTLNFNAPEVDGGANTSNFVMRKYNAPNWSTTITGTRTGTSTQATINSFSDFQVGEAAPIVLTETHVNVLCNGASTGSIDLSVSGGTSPYSYLWSPGGQTTQDISGLAAGTYSVLVTDAVGDTASTSVTITEPPAIVLSETHVNVACNGDATGSIDLTVSGGTPGYTYLWSPGGETTEDLSGLVAGTYSVTVTDANGCTASTSVTITQPTALLLFETHQNVTCNVEDVGENVKVISPQASSDDGSIDLTVSGGTAPYTYFWAPNGETTEDLSDLAAGTYTVTVSDSLGCTDTLSVTITQPPLLALTVLYNNVSCYGANDGSIDVSVTGGTPGYTYLWSPGGETTEDLSGLAPGVYMITVTDAESCQVMRSVTISEPDELILGETHTDVTCNGAADGTIDLTPTGGTEPYTYLWSPGGETDEDLSGLGPGTYSVTVTDDHGCTASTSVTITEPPALVLVETHANVSCYGATDGSIDLSVSGGTPGYSYLWSPGGETTEDLANLGPGTYSVTVTDANGCMDSLSVTITEPPALVLSETHDNVSCYGAADGAIDLSVSGGTPGYSYLWSPGGETTEDLANLGPGTYSVTVTDAGGCMDSLSVTITEPAELTLSETHANVSCYGAADGSIDLSVSGGTPGYTYLWSPGGETTEDLSNLGPGTYSVTVTDANGCTASTSVMITEPDELLLSETHVNVSCYGAADGSIDLSVSGGTPGYSYLWSPGGETTQDLSNLGPGIYSVTVTDANNCTDSLSVTITEPDELLLSETHVNVSCNGDSTGSIDLTVSGGTPGYTYLWSPGGETTQDLSGLAAGTYSVTVTDANGCTETLSVTITQSSSILLSETHVNVSCYGGSDGSIDLSVSGGTPGYTYLWSPGGETTQDLSNLGPGTYSVTVTDAGGCTASTSVTITEPAELTLSETHVNVSCYGAADGSIDLSVSGGTPGYTYLWSPGGETTQDLSNLGPGTYGVTVTDANGCTDSLSVTITEPAELVLSETHVNASCYGASDGSIDLSVSGGTPGYTYLWSPGGETTQDLSGLAAGTYSVTVTDANDCTASTSVTITEPDEIVLSETHVNVACNGGSTGSIDLTVSGGTPGYSYLWSPGGETTEDLSGLAAGTYSVTVTDTNDCTATLSVTITESDGIILSETHTNVSCNGGSDGSIDLSVSGGTPGYAYLWSPGGETTQDLSGLAAGTYSVTVTDTTGCTASLSVTVTEPDALVLTETHVNVGCNGSPGSIDLTVSGGTPGYTYLWTPGGETTEDLSGLSAGTYCVTVTDANDCTDSLCVTIEDRPVYTIVATAGPGGSITPSGTILVPCGGDTTFIIIPDPGYMILDVEVDSVSVGPTPIYTFTNVTANHTIHATFDIIVATWLSVFSANPMPEGIELRWQLAEAGTFAEVLLERGIGVEGPWTRVTQPIRTEGSAAVVLDQGLTAGVTYHYRLTGVERDGRSISLGRITGTAGDAIRQFTLAPAWPNPAQAGLVHVEFTLPKETSIHLSVLDIQGREVAVVTSGSYPAGSYHVAWTGETDRGATAPSGVYFLVLQSGEGASLKQRIVLAR